MAKVERRFQYQKRTREDVKTRANMKTGGFDSVFKPQYKKYKMRDGKNVIRVLPPTWDKANHYGYDFWVNYSIGADNAAYLSLSKMGKGRDPLEEARRDAQRHNDEELVKQLAPRQRVLMWIIDRQAEDEGPQLFDAPVTVDKALSNLCIDEDTKEVLMIDDPEEGRDFRFYKEGAGLKTDYDASKMKLLNPSVLCDDQGQQDEWLNYIQDNPVPECLQFYEYDHISSVFNGAPPTKADDEDDNKPKRSTRRQDPDEEEPRTPPRKRPAVDKDEEREEKPLRRRPEPVADEKPARSRPALQDDEPPFDPDEQEEEKPTRKSNITERLSQRRRPSNEGDDD